jgi:hypothetical protein
MPERRASRTLRDVSHLFLSGSRPARTETRCGTACVWIAAADASVNRAHLAAGLAAALARQGIGVSLLELCGNLPTIGYYFGMESGDYLAPALDRAALVRGSWNGAVDFCFSANVSSFDRCRGGWPERAAAPRAVVAVFPYPRRNAVSLLAALRDATAAVGGTNAPGGCPPDAFVIAGAGGDAERLGTCAAAMRKAFPGAAGFLVADRSVPEAETFERIPPPDEARASWARRMPPGDPWFDELAAGLLQVVSMRRRGTVSRAAKG